MKMSIRNILSYFVANILIQTGFVRRAIKKSMTSERILSIYFHKPTKAEFQHCVSWLKKMGFQFLSTCDVEKILQLELPFPSGSVLLTADDGWQSNVVNIVEVASEFEVPVTIFVSTTPVEEGAYWWSYVQSARQSRLALPSKKALKKMPEEERIRIIEEIKKKVTPKRDAMMINEVKAVSQSGYVTIGCHTMTHPILINCSKAQVYEELKISRRKLEAWTGKEVAYFAYPNGDYRQREIQILKALNYRLAFSSRPQYLTPDSLKDHFTLPRFSFLSGASFEENICRITGVWQPILQGLGYSSDFLK